MVDFVTHTFFAPDLIAKRRIQSQYQKSAQGVVQKSKKCNPPCASGFYKWIDSIFSVVLYSHLINQPLLINDELPSPHFYKCPSPHPCECPSPSTLACLGRRQKSPVLALCLVECLVICRRLFCWLYCWLSIPAGLPLVFHAREFGNREGVVEGSRGELGVSHCLNIAKPILVISCQQGTSFETPRINTDSHLR